MLEKGLKKESKCYLSDPYYQPHTHNPHTTKFINLFFYSLFRLGGLRSQDNISATIKRSKYKHAKDDEFDTPDHIYYGLINRHKISPELDVFATEWRDENDVLKTNSKCIHYFTIEDNALEVEWLIEEDGKSPRKPTGIWWNDPHSLHPETLIKSEEQWLKHDLDILGILPANTIRPPYFYNHVGRYMNKGIIIEPVFDWDNYLFGDKTEKEKWKPRPRSGYMRFLKRGKDTDLTSHNGYLAIRYYSKDSWTKFIKYRIKELRSYP